MVFVLELICSLICSFAASSGFWLFIQSRCKKKDASDDLLIGLGHDRIMSLGNTYVERGYISMDEYENLHDYLFVPYSKAGGNGSAERIMDEVNKLQIKQNDDIKEK